MRLNLYLKIKNLNNSGLSLPLVIGLVSVLMAASVAVNALVIRNLKSTGQLEAATRAYLAAEGGIEDALYELSAHFAGYETPDLGNQDARTLNFEDTVKNQWSIQSHLNSGDPHGAFTPDNKLTLSLFNDEGDQTSSIINTINVANNFSVKFKIPEKWISFPNFNGLVVDNDRDGRINEDAKGDNNPACIKQKPTDYNKTPADNDCDGKIDEDSDQDPVIYWKIYDDAGHVLTPLSGCLSDSAPGNEKSELCEKEFLPGKDFQVTLTQEAVGENQSDLGAYSGGQHLSIFSFINTVFSINPHTKLVMEFLIVAPLEDATNPLLPIKISSLEYQISYDTNLNLPDPAFTFKSDGFVRDFKQSLTATIKPRALMPLFDFTILQQE
ncbi:hypothetical protein HZA43_06035 [Candidatus Peregrinibacteria bacterium]|nr:hypothetical protein [Candidatus Peregrinibacteria bacterium]